MAEAASYSRRGLVGGAKATTLNGDLAATGGIAGTDLSTWVGATTNGPICWTLDRGLASEESGEATGISSNNLTGVTRGLFGTTGQAHTSGAALELTASKKDFDEANQAVVQTIGKATTAGDLLYATAASVLARLGIGTANQALYTNAGATAPTWGASAKSALTTTGDSLYASAANTLARLGIGSTGQVLTVAAGLPSWATPGTAFVPSSAVVATAQGTTTSTYVDLATSGPAVTVTTGASALVILSAYVTNGTVDGVSSMGYAVSGATTVAASDSRRLESRGGDVNDELQGSAVYVHTGLTPGSNIFTAKYKQGGTSTATFSERGIIVIPI